MAVATSVVGTFVSVAVPLVEKRLVDRSIVVQSEAVLPLMGALIGLGIFGFLLSFLRRYFGGKLALGVQYELRSQIYEHLQRLDFARQDEMQTGQLVSRSNADVGLIQGLLAFLPRLLGNLLLAVLAIVVMFVVYWPLAILVTASFPVLVFASLKLRSMVFPASWDSQQKEGEVAVVVEEAVTGIRTIKALAREEAMVSRLRAVASKLYSSRIRTIRMQSKLQAVLQAVPMITQAAVLGVGGLAAYSHRLTLGAFLLFASYVVELNAPIRQLSALVAFAEQARAGAERIFQLLDTLALVREKPEAKDPVDVYGKMILEDVHFGYRAGEEVLRGLSLTVEAGESVAIVGPSGCGKSTLALLLPRFYDSQGGSVKLDDVDVRDLSLSGLRAQVGVVFEESFLFSDTIFRNIALARQDSSEEDVIKAAKAARAHDFIIELPDGYQTMAGEKGVRLSGGQRQRIALARALLSTPKVLILDDATSAIDAETEAEIHSALESFAAQATMILIAHRKSTLQLADRIVVMDRGRVVAQGSHQELESTSSLYKMLISGEEDLLIEELQGEQVGAERTDPSKLARSTQPESRKPIERVGGSGHSSMHGFSLSATDELLAALANLPPAKEEPGLVLGEFRAHRGGEFRFFSMLRSLRGLLVFGGVLVGVDAVLSLSTPAFIRSGIDGGVLQHRISLVVMAALALALVSLVDALVVWREGVVTGTTSEKFLYMLRSRIFEQLMIVGMDYYEAEMAGRVMTRMTSDVDSFANLIQSGLIAALVSVVSFFGVLVVLVVMSPSLSLAPLATLPFLVVATFLFQRYSSRAYERSRETVAAVNANFQEGVSGVRVNQAYAIEENSNKQFRNLSANYRDARMSAQKMIAIYFPFVLLLADLASALTLGLGSRLVHSGAVQVGTVIAFALYVDQLFSPIQQLSQTFDQVQQARVAARQIRRLMAVELNTPVSKDALSPYGIVGEVSFQDVAFSYPSVGVPILRGLSLDVAAGTKVAIVGETGAGKSTLAKLLVRFYDPSSGAVLLDGIDIRRLDLQWYRSRVGYLPQEPFLFSGSIFDNVSFAKPDASDQEVLAACKEVGVTDFLVEFSDGIDHEVGEQGKAISAGQRQLVALARLYLSKPSLLVLDEVSSSLDLRSEAKAQKALDLLCAGRTTFIVAHRLPSAQGCDLIVVLEDGEIIEMGSHEELRSHGGKYTRMWELFEDESLAS